MKITLTAAGITADIDPASCQDITQPGYRAPSLDDIHAVKNACQWSRAEIANQLGVNAKLAGNWLNPGQGSSSQIPWASWIIWLHKAGLIEIG
ncbi:hypothetical protein NFHSH190041_37110 (plasmid) [Shewanella sp. NFH-SH190041]|uniref:hypothetical protein n=1 Tax=Shewanella sp. NFH-SH190041 TaxID=2950245 RepID=UPI0021C375A5|nr:hypothetical protein [Shewanella sp. NFH-SH190041]BDM66259.1 hypothetical protein NFHSH190041_37110 [Shewanella sp. NFH-SH190041]